MEYRLRYPGFEVFGEQVFLSTRISASGEGYSHVSSHNRMFEFALYYQLRPVLGCVSGNDADRLTIRCLLRRIPLEKWPDYYDMGSSMLKYVSKADGQASRIPADAERAMQDKIWARKELEH